MILGTAGHVDHGKTSLVRALTGTDTDRLAEEKRRGMTIELGFAYAGEGEARFGIVDVPGHDRFLPTMVAGAASMEAVLFCIAADEGPRQQTREHLRVLDLLGIRRGLIVLTRADRADAARRAAVAAQARALVQGTGLSDAPLLAVSAVTGEGIDTLRQAIAALRRPRPEASGGARLAVDRVFVKDGVGLVVAGYLQVGRIAEGDTVVLSPAGRPARVRSLRANDEAVSVATAGARVAVNLAGDGIGAGAASRGDWLVAPPLHRPTRRLDVRLLGLESAAPKSGILHAGAAHVPFQLDPLGEAFAAVSLGTPLPLLAGDRLLLRGPDGAVVCGAEVLDPAPPTRGRRSPGRLCVLSALASADPPAALLAQPPGWVDTAAYAAARNMDPASNPWRWAVRVGQWALSPSAWDRLSDGVVAAIAAHHAALPDSPGLVLPALRRTLDPRPPLALLEAALDRLAGEGRVARAGPAWRLASHTPALSPADRVLADRLLSRLAADPLRPRPVHELAAEIELAEHAARSLLRRLARLGEAIEVAPGRFLAAFALPRLAEAIQSALEADGRLRPGPFRDAAGCGRNMAIALLEWLDRAGVTVRRGDARLVRADRLTRLRGPS